MVYALLELLSRVLSGLPLQIQLVIFSVNLKTVFNSHVMSEMLFFSKYLLCLVETSSFRKNSIVYGVPNTKYYQKTSYRKVQPP